MAEAAGLVLSSVIEQLASDDFHHWLNVQLGMVKEVVNDVAELQSNLQTIQAVLEDVKKKQLQSPSARDWLEKLIEVCFYIDDVVSKWNYYFLKSKVEGEDESLLVSNEKVRYESLALEMNELNEKLNNFDKEKNVFDYAKLIPVGSCSNLEGYLSLENRWLKFKQLALSEKGKENSAKFEEVGMSVIRKYQGLPLVEKILKELMCFKKTIMHCNDELSSLMFELPERNKELFDIFFLGYNDLPPLERCCFSYCSVFPKDYRVTSEELVDIWMSQGYISVDQNLAKKGLECFETLATHSFFQDFEIDCDGSILSCKMHDRVHDFAQFLSKNDCLCKQSDSETENVNLPCEKVRHFSILVSDKNKLIPCLISYQSNMRTFFALESLDGYVTCHRCEMSESFSNLTSLRTLGLRSCDLIDGLPKEIGDFIHLRYLNLSYNEIIEDLPDSLCNLYNLQTLNLNFCKNLFTLPEGMEKLINLRHLYIKNCFQLEGLPKGISRLSTSLKRLNGMVVPWDNKDNHLSTTDFGNLKQLEGGHLQVIGCRFVDVDTEAKQLGLVERDCVTHLELHFGPVYQTENDMSKLEALQPHPNLKSLQITEYGGEILSASWITSLTSLRKLVFYECQNNEFLMPLGKLPLLESITFYCMGDVEKLGLEFLGISEGDSSSSSSSTCSTTTVLFPKLKELILEDMSYLEEWQGAMCTIMPCLEYLEIKYCHYLKALPEFIFKTPLQKLIIRHCDLLSQRYQMGNGAEWHKISHIPYVVMK